VSSTAIDWKAESALNLLIVLMELDRRHGSIDVHVSCMHAAGVFVSVFVSGSVPGSVSVSVCVSVSVSVSVHLSILRSQGISMSAKFG
jgi:hypothetical protein